MSGNYDGIGSAVFNGIKDLFIQKEPFGMASETADLSGKNILITGANSGLGYATACRLAKMGASVIMACRSGIPEAAERCKKESGSEAVSMEYVDLTSLGTIDELVSRLKKRGIILDVLVCNAGVVTAKSRLTSDGFDTMFQVNYLSKFYLVNKFLDAGILRTISACGEAGRIVFVSSEAHRTGRRLDLDALGEPAAYSIGESMANYGYNKLLLTMFARALTRRRGGDANPAFSVFILCPGPVASNIAREVPRILKPLLRFIFAVFFPSPIRASDPVVFLASDLGIEGMTDVYLHLMVKKDPDPRTADKTLCDALWEKSEKLIASCKNRSNAGKS